MLRIGILEPGNFSEHALLMLKTKGKVSLNRSGKLNSFLSDKNILFIRLKYFVGKDFLDHCQNLRLICTPTTGLTHIDIDEIKKRNINIISLKGELKFLNKIRATPEHTIGLTLSLLRNYKSAFLTTKNNKWNRDLYKGYELFESRVGIIGYGRIGKLISKYLQTFGAQVSFYDKDKIKEDKKVKRMQTINSLINNSTIIILCASYSKSDSPIIGKAQIDLLKNKFFINISRGELIEENYLLQKLKNNFFKGFATDVIANEQRDKNNTKKWIKVAEGKNIIITPHIGGATYQSMWKTEEFIVNKLIKLLNR